MRIINYVAFFSIWIWLVIVIEGCTISQTTTSTSPAASKVEQKDIGSSQSITQFSFPFVPPTDQTILIIGQDTSSIEGYVAATGHTPHGVTGYTSLANLEGLTEAASYGSGPHHMDRLAKIYPDSALAVGLYLVDYLDDINSGKADSQIDALLEILAGYERPVFLRFGYEFDGQWNRYRPEPFKDAWIRFHKRMAEKEVDNVAMVWQSATYCDGNYSGYASEAWYPGDEYVDWVGLSYFIQTDCDLEPLTDLVNFARERGKPVMIAEATPQRYAIETLTYSTSGRSFDERTAEQIWAEWYVPFFDFVTTNRDTIRAVAYINAHWDAQSMWGSPYSNGYWGDSRVEANPLILERWLAEVTSAAWLK